MQRIAAAPDSVVSLRVAAVRFPILAGENLADSKLYGKPMPTHPLQVDLTGSRKVEVHGFSAGRTLVLVGGVALIALLIYAAAQSVPGGDFHAGDFGGIGGSYPAVSPSPPAH